MMIWCNKAIKFITKTTQIPLLFDNYSYNESGAKKFRNTLNDENCQYFLQDVKSLLRQYTLNI